MTQPGPTRARAALDQLRHDVALGLSRVDPLRVGEINAELGVEVTKRHGAGYLELLARPTKSWSLFTKGEVLVPWHDPKRVEGRALMGVRYKLGRPSD